MDDKHSANLVKCDAHADAKAKATAVAKEVLSMTPRSRKAFKNMRSEADLFWYDAASIQDPMTGLSMKSTFKKQESLIQKGFDFQTLCTQCKSNYRQHYRKANVSFCPSCGWS